MRHTLAALAVGACLTPALAQSGAIEVRVLDESGAPLPGATVTLSNKQGLVAAAALVTDANGRALFPVLRAGREYVVEAALPGFAAQRREELRVGANSTTTVRIKLGAAIVEHIRVSGRGDAVDLDEVGQSTRFSDEFIEALPVRGRFYQDMLDLAPGVTDHDNDGNPNVHGSRSRDFRAEVSGVSNVDPLTGFWLSRINSDSIEEIEIVPLGAGVEFGRAQGGFARVVQKQGTNRFEGVASLIFRSSKLDGDGAGNADRVSPQPEFRTFEPGIQVSGPIIKDRLWYRLSHQYIERQDPVNTLGGIAVTTREQWLNADQLTWQVSPRNKLSLQYQNDPLSQNGLGLNSDTGLVSTRKLERRGPTWSLAWTAPVSPRVLFESTVAIQDHSVDLLPTADDLDGIHQQDCVRFKFLPGLQNTRCTNITSGRVSGPHYERSEDERGRLTLRTQATVFQPAGNQSHRLKIGTVIEQETYERTIERNPDVTVEFSGGAFGDPVAFAAARVGLPRQSTGSSGALNWAVWVEDQWRPSSGLAVTLGLRVDREEISSEGHDRLDVDGEAAAFLDTAFERDLLDDRVELRRLAREFFSKFEDIFVVRDWLANALRIHHYTVRFSDIMEQSKGFANGRRATNIEITNTNLSPRLSVAWDPWRNGRTKLAVTAGRYYDKIFLAIPLVELEPIETVLNWTPRIREPRTDPLIYEVPSSIVTMTPVTARMLDRDLRTPYQDELTISAEREIFRETSLRATYVRRKYEDQFQDVDANSAPGDFGHCRHSIVDGWFVRESPGTGQHYVDVNEGVIYVDDDPGIGDGRLDSCPPGPRLDLYVKNPAWRELMLVGNFNRSEYRAVVVEVVRRFFRNWELQASYTWSEAEGDAEDFDLLNGNEQNRFDDERGRMAFNRTNVAKLNVASWLPGSWRFGAALRWESGLPYSIVKTGFASDKVPRFYPWEADRGQLPRLRLPTGERNDQANASLWNVDLRVSKVIPLSGRSVLELSVEAFNLLNDGTLVLEDQVNGRQAGTARFGRSWQFGIRATF